MFKKHRITFLKQTEFKKKSSFGTLFAGSQLVEVSAARESVWSTKFSGRGGHVSLV